MNSFKITFVSGDLYHVSFKGTFTNPLTGEVVTTNGFDWDYRIRAINPLRAIEKAEKYAFNVKGNMINVKVLKEKTVKVNKQELFQMGMDKYHSETV